MSGYRASLPVATDTQAYAARGYGMPFGDALPTGVLVTDGAGKCLYSNKAYQKLCGWSKDKVIGSLWTAVIHPQDQEEAVRHWHAALQGLEPFMFETRLQTSAGEVLWTRRNAAPLEDDVYVHTVDDISTYKANEKAWITAEEQLFEEKERAQVTLDSIGDAVLTINIHGRVVYMNVVAEKLTGFSCEEAAGRPLNEVFDVVDANTHKPAADPARRAIRSGSTVALEANSLLVTRDGSEVAIEDSAAPIRNRHGATTGAVIVFHDARFSRETTARMEHLARHDALTGLYNRNAFHERFEHSQQLAKRHDTRMGVLFIDVDHFKTVNDRLGHDSGDKLLLELAFRLKLSVRTTDTICRYGGDEFVVLLGEIDQPTQAFAVADKILQTVAAPMVINGHEVEVQLSIGVSVYPDDGVSADVLLSKADKAMYRIKMANRSG